MNACLDRRQTFILATVRGRTPLDERICPADRRSGDQVGWPSAIKPASSDSRPGDGDCEQVTELLNRKTLTTFPPKGGEDFYPAFANVAGHHCCSFASGKRSALYFGKGTLPMKTFFLAATEASDSDAFWGLLLISFLLWLIYKAITRLYKALTRRPPSYRFGGFIEPRK